VFLKAFRGASKRRHGTLGPAGFEIGEAHCNRSFRLFRIERGQRLELIDLLASLALQAIQIGQLFPRRYHGGRQANGLLELRSGFL